MKKVKKSSILLIAAGVITAIFTLFPVYIMIINSFKGRAQIFTDTMGLPKSLDFSYYATAIQRMNFGRALINSLIISVFSIVLIIIFSSMTAWVLERNNTKLSNFVFYSLVATMLIPFQVVMIPLMQYMSDWEIKLLHFSMIDTHYGLVFMNIGFGTSLSVFLYHGFIKGIPRSLEEAAMIDGCNKFQVFWKIVFPSLKPINVTVAILNVISIWNDYLLPSLVLRSPSLRTIPLSTFYFFGQFTIQWNLAMAGLVLTIIPIIIFYLFGQKYIIKGVMEGAVK